MIVFMTYVLPTVSGAIMLLCPATLQIYFFVTAALGFVQSRLIQNSWVRAKLGITPMPVKPQNPGTVLPGVNTIEAPAEEAARKAKENMSFVDKGVSKF